MEKMLVTSTFSFNHKVFYPIKDIVHFILLSANAFHLDQFKSLSFGNGLTLYHIAKRLVQKESISQQHFSVSQMIAIDRVERKHCVKRRDCWLPSILSFSQQCFQKPSFQGLVKLRIVW